MAGIGRDGGKSNWQKKVKLAEKSQIGEKSHIGGKKVKMAEKSQYKAKVKLVRKRGEKLTWLKKLEKESV